MKKITMLSLLLIGLGMSAKLSAQQNLYVVNNTLCTVTVVLYSYDGSCGGMQVSTYISLPGISATAPNFFSTCTAIVAATDVTINGSPTTNVGMGCSFSSTTGTVPDCSGGTSHPISYTPPTYTSPAGGQAISDAMLTIN